MIHRYSLPFSQQPATGTYPETNPIHTFLPYLPKIHSNISLPSTLRFSAWSLPFRFPDQNFVCISHLTHIWSTFCQCWINCDPKTRKTTLSGNMFISDYIYEYTNIVW